MSTNKRKEAAALFELLDKSTLKVPKGGSLKIPSWWSSKTNPAPAAPPPPADLPDLPAATPRPTLKSPAAAPVPPLPSPQQRLFEPPPADAPPAISPSIRPPAAPAPAQVPVVEPAPAPKTTVVISEDELDTEPTPRASTANATPRVFAPQTYDQTGARRNRLSSKGLFARTPPWAVLTAGGAVLCFLILMVWLFARHHQQTAATPGKIELPSANSSFSQERNGAQPLVAPAPGHGGSILPPPQPRTPILQQNATPETAAPDAANETSDSPGKVYAPGTVERDAKLWYIIIASTPQSDVAQRNADFIAKNGVDVSIEAQKSPKGRGVLYTLISVKGFPTLGEAEPYRKRIVQIGHKTLDFQKYRKAWDDAYATHVKSLAQQGK